MIGKGGTLRTNRGDEYLVELEFTTANTSAPTSVAPDYGSDMVVAYSTTGTYTVTFSNRVAPLNLKQARADIFGDEPNLTAKCVSYSSNVLTIKVYNNASGTITATNTTGKRVHVQLTCSDSGYSD